MPEDELFKISFLNEGTIYEIYARQVAQSNLFGFIEIEEFVFGENTSVVVDPTQEDLEQVVKKETNGEGAEVVGEFVGHLLDVCVQLARFGGRILLVGCDELARPPIPQARMVFYELQMIGAVLPKYTFSRAVKMLEQGKVPIDKIVSHQIPLERVHEGFQLVREGKAIKVVICPTDADLQD